MGGAGSNGERDRVWHLRSGSAEAVGGAGSDKERGPAATVGGSSTDKKLTLKCMCICHVEYPNTRSICHGVVRL